MTDTDDNQARTPTRKTVRAEHKILLSRQEAAALSRLLDSEQGTHNEAHWIEGFKKSKNFVSY
jgi:hypothetical protein